MILYVPMSSEASSKRSICDSQPIGFSAASGVPCTTPVVVYVLPHEQRGNEDHGDDTRLNYPRYARQLRYEQLDHHEHDQ